VTVAWRWLRRIVFALGFLLLGLIFGGAVNARLALPDLKPWHRVRLDDVTEATLSGNFTFKDYAAREAQLFDRVRTLEIDAADRTTINRYNAGSRSNPAQAGRNWNQSYEIEPAGPVRGGALLLHGLTDSPYSMRAVAEVLRENGIYSLAMRMPGHGTLPSGLVTARWQDWLSAVRVGAHHVRSRIPGGAPLILVGYSNGGALALKYTFDTIQRAGDPMPSKIILMSPMIGVTPAARLARWIGFLGFVPFFEKANWIDVVPEYNPFKYNSFPANAGLQTSLITRALYEDFDRIHASNLADRLPPILTFQSIVDSTVSASAVLHALYERLPANGSELVLFDVNRATPFDLLLSPGAQGRLAQMLPVGAQRYRSSVIANTAGESMVSENSRLPGSTSFEIRPLELAYPASFFSLSHVALPFPPGDSRYGTDPDDEDYGVHLGSQAPRAERGTLINGADTLVRASCNPFFDYLRQRIEAGL